MVWSIGLKEKDKTSTQWLSPLVLDGGLAIEFRDDHVHVDLGKDYRASSEDREAVWKKIGEICERHKTRRVLVEGFLPSGERETTDVVDAGQKTAVVPRLWLAFAIAGFEPTEQTELYIAIAAARGVRVKFFDDRERALLWLRNNAEA